MTAERCDETGRRSRAVTTDSRPPRPRPAPGPVEGDEARPVRRRRPEARTRADGTRARPRVAGGRPVRRARPAAGGPNRPRRPRSGPPARPRPPRIPHGVLVGIVAVMLAVVSSVAGITVAPRGGSN